MKLSELLFGVETVSVSGSLDVEITGVTNDSRAVREGYLFIAVRGFETDGHRYIPSAVKNGAAAVVAEEPAEGVTSVTVASSRLAEALIAANFYGRPAEELCMVGVTGTNGKTTTTNLVKTILEGTTGKKVGLIGTNKNVIGDVEEDAERTTPDSLELHALLRRMVDAGCEYCVMEVSSHALYLDRVAGIRFSAAAFTNLTEDHLDFHKTMDAYAEAKSRIFRQCDWAVINIDDPYSKVMLDAALSRVTTFSTKDYSASLSAQDIRLKPDGVSFRILCEDGIKLVRLGIPGMFSVYNALCALSIAKALRINTDRAIEALASSHGVKGRAEIVPTGRDFTVLIDYAHSPDAMVNILRTVRGFAKGRVVLLFGCGGDREREKRPVMGAIAVQMADMVYITSDNPRTEEPGEIIREILEGVKNTKTPYRVIENRRDAIKAALGDALADDVIILAGKGHETYQIIGKEKFHFDEREIVADILSNS